MEAPNKIYIDGVFLQYDNIEVAHTPIAGDIEYIGKDAILDKLKTQRDKCVYKSTYWDFWQAVITEIKAL
jgi:hypothetical protein